tara:strand:+ start:1585 stop:1947 length:363 start_codon:yes stop_codon:yes gene_type:complete
MKRIDLTNAGKPWTKKQERTLVRLKLVSNYSFDEISIILKRSSRALKLRFCLIVDSIDWQGINSSFPISVDPMDEIVRLIIAGSTPCDIALKFPRQFVDNHIGIRELWEHTHKKLWRYFP